MAYPSPLSSFNLLFCRCLPCPPQLFIIDSLLTVYHGETRSRGFFDLVGHFYMEFCGCLNHCSTPHLCNVWPATRWTEVEAGKYYVTTSVWGTTLKSLKNCFSHFKYKMIDIGFNQNLHILLIKMIPNSLL